MNITRYTSWQSGMIKDNNGGYMLASEVLPEIERLRAEIEAMKELSRWNKSKCKTCGFAAVWKDGSAITCRNHAWGYDHTQQMAWGWLEIDSSACPDYVNRELQPLPQDKS